MTELAEEKKNKPSDLAVPSNEHKHVSTGEHKICFDDMFIEALAQSVIVFLSPSDIKKLFLINHSSCETMLAIYFWGLLLEKNIGPNIDLLLEKNEALKHAYKRHTAIILSLAPIESDDDVLSRLSAYPCYHFSKIVSDQDFKKYINKQQFCTYKNRLKKMPRSIASKFVERFLEDNDTLRKIVKEIRAMQFYEFRAPGFRLDSVDLIWIAINFPKELEIAVGHFLRNPDNWLALKAGLKKYNICDVFHEYNECSSMGEWVEFPRYENDLRMENIVNTQVFKSSDLFFYLVSSFYSSYSRRFDWGLFEDFLQSGLNFFSPYYRISSLFMRMAADHVLKNNTLFGMVISSVTDLLKFKLQFPEDSKEAAKCLADDPDHLRLVVVDLDALLTFRKHFPEEGNHAAHTISKNPDHLRRIIRINKALLVFNANFPSAADEAARCYLGGEPNFTLINEADFLAIKQQYPRQTKEAVKKFLNNPINLQSIALSATCLPIFKKLFLEELKLSLEVVLIDFQKNKKIIPNQESLKYFYSLFVNLNSQDEKDSTLGIFDHILSSTSTITFFQDGITLDEKRKKEEEPSSNCLVM